MLVLQVVAQQQNFFIYLQTSNAAPFYIKHNKKVYSSTAQGYIILSNLTPGTQTILLGYPKSTQPEIAYAIPITNADEGYTIQANEATTTLINVVTNVSITPYSSNSTVITYPDKQPTIGNPTTTPLPLTPSTITNTTSPVLLHKLQPSTNGADAIYYVLKSDNTTQDTIRIYIPIYPAAIPLQQPNTITPTATPPPPQATTSTSPTLLPNITVTPAPVADTSAALPLTTTNNSTTAIPTVPAAIASNNTVSSTLINTDCKKTATQNDYLKLRQKMAGTASEMEMLTLAKKAMEKTCFTTTQIQGCAMLLTTDFGKLQLYKQSYKRTYDYSNFKNLQATLSSTLARSEFDTIINK